MKNGDQITTISELREILKEFRDARNWKQFHTPKNLSNAISIEAAELMEHFLWETEEESDKIVNDSSIREEIEDELADIICFCFNFANVMDIDVSKAVLNKIVKNNLKYPIEKAKDNAKKYTQL